MIINRVKKDKNTKAQADFLKSRNEARRNRNR